MSESTTAEVSRPRRRRTKGSRKVALAAIALTATLVLLEGVLQISALVVYFASRKPTIDVGAATDSILCVGDSWTHGMGCSDATKHSYPAVVQELLQKRTGKAWAVINGGQSGQNSRDVLLRLPSQLQASKPKYVLVLVGRNDMWSRPEAVDDATRLEDYQAYRFRWRLPRLWAWAYGAVVGEAPQPQVVKAPVPRGPEWDPRRIPWQNAYPKEPAIGKYVPETEPGNQAGWQAVDANDYPAAITAFEGVRALAPEDAMARSALVRAYARAGRPAEAKVELDWLTMKWQETQNYWVGRGLMMALDSLNQHGEAKVVAMAFLAKWPDDATVRTTMAWAEFQLGDLAAGYASIRLAEKTWQSTYTFMVRRKIELFERRFEDALASCLECYVVTNEAKALQDDLSDLLSYSQCSAQLLRSRLQEFPCDAAVRGRMSEVAEDCIAALDGAGQERVLRQHWSRIVAHCMKHGAVPVFLTYPVGTPFGRQTVAFANEHGIASIDVETEFATKVGQARTIAMRSSDGHVNDEGYRLMAEFVVDGLMRTPGWK